MTIFHYQVDNVAHGLSLNLEICMKLLKTARAIFTVMSFVAATMNAQDMNPGRYDSEINERDSDVLRDFLDQKKMIDFVKDGAEITIDADIHAEWRNMNETLDGKKLRGRGATTVSLGNYVGANGEVYPVGSVLPVAHNDFDAEFNLHFTYDTKRTWAVAHLQFDNSMGVDDSGIVCKIDPHGWHGSGNVQDIALKQAYIGYQVYKDDDNLFEIEIGRRGNIYKIFDSEIQFLSRCDGIVLRYNGKWQNVGEVCARMIGFVVDERVKQFAYGAEVALEGVAGTGLDVKYSLIDWRFNRKNRCFKTPWAFDFLVSQLTFVYNFKPSCYTLYQPLKVFAAAACNHAANKRGFRVNKKETNAAGFLVVEADPSMGRKNWGWYAGFTLGDINKEGDWSFEAMFQWVEAKAVPDRDASGIGNGNVLGETFTQIGRGNTNFWGAKFEGLYALTDELTLDTIVEFSHSIDPDIAGRHTYSKFELEAVYAF